MMMRRIEVTVLMSLYWRERPEWLRVAMESVWGQTAVPDEVVLVLDGPVGDELKEVVKDFEERSRADEGRPEGERGPRLKVVRREQNGGLGRALNDGLRHCSHELVARMDTDDIMHADRLEQQYELMTAHPEVAASSAWVDEFIDDPAHPVSTRRLPEQDPQLRRFAMGRSPLNHPAVMFRRSAVEAAGGYEDFPLFEDYWLWARMLARGCKFYNIQRSLLSFRWSADTVRRRGGWSYACNEVRFQRRLCALGLTSTACAMKNIAIRFGVRMIPNSCREWIYAHLLR